MSADNAKRAAAERALALVEPGMRLGLGTGSTASFFVEALGLRVAAGLDILAVPTSEATRRQAEGLGIRLATLDEAPDLDLTIDGADEIDPDLNLIKGGGGALLHEKLVAYASRRLVVIADSAKRVARLGRFPLPVEIVPFGGETTARRIRETLREHSSQAELRLRSAADGRPFLTDGGHMILDLEMGQISAPGELGSALKHLVGVVEHGLFAGVATCALIGTATGVDEMGRGQAA